ALAHLEKGSYREAVSALVKTTQLDPKHAAAQLKLAEVLAATHDKQLLEEGERRLQDLLSTRPDYVDASTALAIVESELGHGASAEKGLELTLEKQPQNLHAAMALARLKVARKDVAGAEEVLKTLASRNSQSVDAANILADF